MNLPIKRVLFVDDDINVLQGLQRMLHSMRADWQMEFVQSARQALERMEKDPFDVVVCDFCMPGMNGAELLNEVMRRFPKTVRLILTGTADEALAFKCVGATHQCLSKPCNPDELKDTIARATSISTSVESEELRALVSRMDRLPTIPSVYTEVIQALQNSRTTVEDIGEIVARDIGMTAKLLKLVNSAFFGLGRTISTPTEAAMYLGLDTVRALVLSANVFSQYESAQAAGCSPEVLLTHSLETAAAAKLIAAEEDSERKLRDEAFVAGMLHDAGKLVLASNFPDKYRAVLSDSARDGQPVAVAERKHFKADHADIGGYLLGLWGLPAPIVEAIALHHAPSRALKKAFGSLTAVHVANVLVQEQSSPFPGVPSEQIDQDYIKSLGLAHRVEAWRAAWRRHTTEGRLEESTAHANRS